MSNATITVSTSRPALLLKLLAAGLVASMVFAMWEMIIEAFIGAGFWATPVYIGATVLRDLQNVGMPVPFNLLGVILGLMGHVGNGAIFAFAFAFKIGSRRNASSARWDTVRLRRPNWLRMTHSLACSRDLKLFSTMPGFLELVPL